ncbi:hypothetical protein [Mesorhizobium sp. CO1-1-3]|uniref:hypothetical protein n=1 Tax=Mesorhizobium sp. CO1-1-3 TaxID=2876634 RepID=UPI001CCAE68E|nr:hypothetical protein [Mesorhizobium sp. CO1-1-3]
MALAQVFATPADAEQKRASQETVGHPIAGTKMEEKENFRVQFLHTNSDNELILFTYPSSPSSGRLPPYALGISTFFASIGWLMRAVWPPILISATYAK